MGYIRHMGRYGGIFGEQTAIGFSPRSTQIFPLDTGKYWKRYPKNKSQVFNLQVKAEVMIGYTHPLDSTHMFIYPIVTLKSTTGRVNVERGIRGIRRERDALSWGLNLEVKSLGKLLVIQAACRRGLLWDLLVMSIGTKFIHYPLSNPVPPHQKRDLGISFNK